jgi:hypothetical protein
MKISTLWISGQKCQYYAQMFERLKMSTLCTSGQKFKNVTAMHKWKLSLKTIHSNYEVDLAVLVVSISSSSGK